MLYVAYPKLFIPVYQLLDSKLAQCSDAEDASHVIPRGEAAAAANRELRHRSVPAQGWDKRSYISFATVG